MRKSTALILCCALIFVSGNTQSETNVNTKPTPPTSTISTSKSTTVTSASTSSTTVSTSPDPITTTTTASTTTTSSTTEVPKTTTTTQAPSTTNAPTTTTAIPPPSKGKWNINDTNDIIVAQMAVQLIINYEGENKQNLSRIIDVPSEKNKTQVNGTFAAYTEAMKISWKSVGSDDNYVMLNFGRDDKTYALKGVEVLIQPEELPGTTLNTSLKLVHKADSFNTTIGNSYRCVRLQTFNLTQENDAKVVGQMKVTELQFQAFKSDKKPDIFGLAEDCAFDTPDAVPIAVGCILAGLVVIVLVAYLISRKRSQARGYVSM